MAHHETLEVAQVIAEGSSASEKQKEETIEDDDLYCLQSSFVFFQVEKRIFHVPSYRFADESTIFAGMFRLPQPSLDVEGSSRERPIILPQEIRRNDFRNFLKALYPLNVSLRLTLSKDEWISVLRLATFWYFLKYRQIAISELKKAGELTLTDKIVYGKEFKIQSWVEEGCSELVKRNHTIDKQEALTIGYNFTFVLFGIRERHLRGVLASTAVTSAIQESLKEELDIIKHFEVEYKVDEVDVEFSAPIKFPEAFKFIQTPSGCPVAFGNVQSPPTPTFPLFDDTPSTSFNSVFSERAELNSPKKKMKKKII